VQTAEAGPVTIRDPLDGTVSAIIQTLAANLDASLQLMDQSPIPFDESFGQDIAEDMAGQLDGQLLLGNGTRGQVNGLIPGGTLSAANSILLTSTNAASGQTWAYGGASIAASAHQMTAQLYSKISTARGLPPESWLVNPTVWAIICGSADGENRPLVLPGVTAKTLHGLPVIEDENIPLSFGGSAPPSIAVSAGVVSPTAGSGNYTPLLLGRWSDLIYFASEPRVAVMSQILSGSLQVRYQVTRYVAALPARIQWGGGNVSYSGTSQGGGVNNGAAVAYGAYYQPQANGPLNLSGAGY
jgi:HK97 family phage major capsid protein